MASDLIPVLNTTSEPKGRAYFVSAHDALQHPYEIRYGSDHCTGID